MLDVFTGDPVMLVSFSKLEAPDETDRIPKEWHNKIIF